MRRIFVSHGAKTPHAKALRIRILKALKAKGFETWEQEGLEEEPGSPWPTTLDRWIAECDGAVILFCEDALKSAWVQAETARLCFRKSRDGKFPVIPVAVQETQPKKIPNYIKETTQLQWIQWWKKSERPRLVSDIVEHFDRNIHDTSAPDPLIGLFVNAVARLSGVNEHCYTMAAGFLKLDIGGWDFRHSHPARLIDVLATRDLSLERIAGALKLLEPLTFEARYSILQDIAVMRLSLGNLTRIPEVVREGDPHRRVFGLAASRLAMAQWQVRRPFLYGPGPDYLEYAVARSHDNPTPDIDAQILSLMRASIEPTDDPERDLRRVAIEPTKTPSIAIVPEPPDCTALLARLRCRFPHIAFGVYGANSDGFAHEILGKDTCVDELKIMDEFAEARVVLRQEH